MTRVLITRAADDIEDISARVRALGATPVCVPLISRVLHPSAIEIASPKSDWLLLTSRWAVEAIHCADLRTTDLAFQTAVVGPATAQAVTALGSTVDLIASEHTAQRLIGEMLLRPNQRVYYPIGNQTPSGPRELIELMGAHVITPVVYTNELPLGAAEALKKNFPVDFAIIFSGSAGKRLASFLKNDGNAQSFKVLAIGPRTADVCQDAGLRVHAIAEEHSLTGIEGLLQKEMNKKN